ncbi:ExbD/TolR family protein [Tundrisphaera lichenicola]|uniref:ExbD/TolR family protein n=1 Tax=Tundrisphaera lichenicola TaxID=2029860 RepID=UPI003EBEDCBF
MLLRRQVSEERDEHIDMTPMVDVVFQLMTFMLFSVQLASEGTVEVPRARHGVGVEETAATFLTLLKPEAPGARPLLKIGGDGEGPPIDAEAAGAAVSKGVAQGLKKVVIQADGAVPEGEVLRLIGELSKREPGVTIHIGVREPE